MLSDQNISLERQNTDNEGPANNYGKLLADFCKTNNRFICNGRIGPDLNGNATNTHGSVIDYVVACPEILSKIRHFYVNQTNIFSDKHFIISWSIDCPEQSHRNGAESSNNKIKIKKDS